MVETIYNSGLCGGGRLTRVRGIPGGLAVVYTLIWCGLHKGCAFVNSPNCIMWDHCTVYKLCPKKRPISDISKGMQIKTTMKYTYQTCLQQWLKLKRQMPSIGKDVENLEFAHTAAGNAKCYSDFGRRFGRFL